MTAIETDSLERVEALVDRQSFSQSHSTRFTRRHTLKTTHTHTHSRTFFKEDRKLKCRPFPGT